MDGGENVAHIESVCLVFWSLAQLSTKGRILSRVAGKAARKEAP
jgi:predicted transcriptional regulator